MNPIQLFFVANIIYFLLPTFDTFTTPLQSVTQGPFKKTLDEMVDAKVKKEGVSYHEYETNFNERSKGEAKTLIILMIPIYAFLISLLFLGQKRYFVEHLVFSLHFFSFMLIFMVFGFEIIFTLIQLTMISLKTLGFLSNIETLAVVQSYNTDLGITFTGGIFYFLYLFTAIKRVYAQSNTESFFKGITAVVLIFIVVKIYRNILFITTFYGLKLSLH